MLTNNQKLSFGVFPSFSFSFIEPSLSAHCESSPALPSYDSAIQRLLGVTDPSLDSDGPSGQGMAGEPRRLGEPRRGMWVIREGFLEEEPLS